MPVSARTIRLDEETEHLLGQIVDTWREFVVQTQYGSQAALGFPKTE